MKRNEPKDIDAICRDGALIDRAMQTATREAIKQHRQAGLLMPVWRDGQTVFITPDGSGNNGVRENFSEGMLTIKSSGNPSRFDLSNHAPIA